MRIIASLLLTIPAIFVASAVAAIIPVVVGMWLPPDVTGAVALIGAFLGFLAGAGIAALWERLRLYGGHVALLACMVLGAGGAYTTVQDMHDYLVPKLEDVEVASIDGETEFMFTTADLAADTSRVEYVGDTYHRAKYSQHRCTYTYAMPVAPGYWLVGQDTVNLTATTNCSDLPEPDWSQYAESEWFRVVTVAWPYDDLVDSGVLLSPADAPPESLLAVQYRIGERLPPAAAIVAGFVLAEVIGMAVIAARRRSA